MKDQGKFERYRSALNSYEREMVEYTRNYATQYALIYNQCSRELIAEMEKNERWARITAESDLVQLWSLVCDTIATDPAKVRSVNPLVNDYDGFMDFVELRQGKSESIDDFYKRWRESYDSFRNKGLSLKGIHTKVYPIIDVSSDLEPDSDEDGPVDQAELKRRKAEYKVMIRDRRVQETLSRIEAIDFLHKVDQKRFAGPIKLIRDRDSHRHDEWPNSVHEAFTRLRSYSEETREPAKQAGDKGAKVLFTKGQAKVKAPAKGQAQSKKPKAKAEGVKCSFCKKTGHETKDCYKAQRAVELFKKSKQDKQDDASSNLCFGFFNDSADPSNGRSSHVSSNDLVEVNMDPLPVYETLQSDLQSFCPVPQKPILASERIGSSDATCNMALTVTSEFRVLAESCDTQL
jgi:hypothetical protein